MAPSSAPSVTVPGTLPPLGGRVLVVNPGCSPQVSRVLGVRDDYLILEPPAVDAADTPPPLSESLGLIYRLKGDHYEAPAVLVSTPSDTTSVYVARVTAAPTRRDRRRAVRVPVQVPMQLTLDSGFVLAGRTVDLSSGGALAEMEPTPSPGERGSIVLGLDSLGSLRCVVEVLRVEPDVAGGPPSVAVAFRHIAVSDRRRFLRFLILAARPTGPRPVGPLNL